MGSSDSEMSLSLSGSPTRRHARPGSGRFDWNELSCFKRPPVPSGVGRVRAEASFSGPLSAKRAQSLHALPSVKVQGDVARVTAESFRAEEAEASGSVAAARLPDLASSGQEELPLERDTAMVLNLIYPCTHDDADKPKRAGGLKRCATFVSGFPPGGGSPSLVPTLGPQAQAEEKERCRKNARAFAKSTLLQLRQKMLDKFSTMRVAFESFAHELPHGGMERELSRKEFAKFLDKHFAGLTREEHWRVFQFLDADRSGGISIMEFHTAVEAVAPVRTMEDLRRKLIALGHNSMRQALRDIEASSGGKRMTQQDLAAALARLGIVDEEDQQCVFSTVHDPHGGTKTVSIEQLFCAMSAVSPALLLEDIRDRLLKKYGSLQAAYTALDVNCNCSVSMQEFRHIATGVWKMTQFEAAKAFRLIDVDCSRSISRGEFVSAMRLAEGNLLLEEIRKKVRQRFRSMTEALLQDEYGFAILPPAAVEEDEESRPPPSPPAKRQASARGSVRSFAPRGPAPAPGSAGRALLAFHEVEKQEEETLRHTPALFQETLAKVQFVPSETAALFELIDVDGDGELTPLEFSRGIRIFAPTCVLDDLRLRCLKHHARLADAFASLPPERRSVVLTSQGVRQTLEELDLADGVNVEAIVDLIEPHRDGGVTISELLSALQAAAPGDRVPLPPEQRDARARQQVRSQMAPFFNCAKEIRADMRVRLPGKGDGAASTLPGLQRKATAPARLLEQLSEDVEVTEEGPSSPGRPPTSTPMPMKQSYIKVTKLVRTLPPSDSGPMIERLRGYYANAGSTVTRDGDLLRSTSQSRFQHFRSLSGHRAVLERSCPQL